MNMRIRADVLISAKQLNNTYDPRTKTIATAQNPTYRPEIDGLRAIAVLAVVLYHFGVPYLGGGFVGVDTFFVISGFLIGGILWREHEATGRLSLKRFYTRRIKRLAPAYFAMAAASAVVAYLVLLPFEFREFGKSLIAATLYLSNVHFFRGEGYFDIGADSKVLLHTWSLSVEEQFYVALPLLFLLFWFSRRWLMGALICGFVASLAACVWLTPASQTTTFYLFPFRAWELLAGVLLAIWGHQTRASFAYHAALSWAGLALLFGAILLVRAGPAFPGYQAFAPVLGAVLIIANGAQTNPVNRALASKLPVFIGLISYSLYLWHWPVLTLSKYARGGYGALEAAAWLGLALALAVLSWRYIERPVRSAQNLGGWKVFGATVLASGAALIFGAYAFLTNGAAARFAPEIRAYIQASSDFNQDWSRCTTSNSGPFPGVETCPIGPEGEPEFLVWGDSHVRAFKEGIELAAYEADVPGLIIWRAGCPPLFGIEKSESAATAAEDASCAIANAQIRAGLASLSQAKRLLLIGRWAYYSEGRGVGLDAENTIQLNNNNDPNRQMSEAWERSITTLAEQFSNIHVLRQVPEVPLYDSREVARALARGEDVGEAKIAVPRKVAEARSAKGELAYARFHRTNRIQIIDPWPALCGAQTCGVLHGDVSYYFDNNHITNTAARALRHLFVSVIKGRAP